MFNFQLGIDVGIDGAITILDSKGRLVDVIDLPVVEIKVGKSTKRRLAPAALVSELEMFAREDCRALVESVSSRPGQGVASVFSFGQSFGIIAGVLAGLKIPTEYVTPATWVREMRIVSGKDGSRQRAMELFPSHADKFKRIKDHNRAESCLIAVYACKYR